VTVAANSRTGAGPRLRCSALNALRLLETCPLVPVDAFAHLAGLSSLSAAYKQLARLKSAGLVEVTRAELGYLVAERRLNLWTVSESGRRALRGSSVEPPRRPRLARRGGQREKLADIVWASRAERSCGVDRAGRGSLGVVAARGRSAGVVCWHWQIDRWLAPTSLGGVLVLGVLP